ncbi:senescence/dehydration-associated protein, chloroplastic-like [Heracleum sosnowskyi]|uniref:Senescence/dehydration-associated protein, chloroplastic-like n=1 Tax=Heracleum sosnowskyi TaxID=360622 RepID=A0AAD8J3I8_9APIA|nr:senescence/dehydration-associated protein, chloroplastic-like [Heracleum sosnowskyi]
MNCFKSKKSSESLSPGKTSSPTVLNPSIQNTPDLRNVKHEVLLRIPGCRLHLMDEGEALELSDGDFTLFRISDGNVSIATTIKVGDDIQWPLTKDEPVVKLDVLHYLFSLPMKNSTPLSYGVTFSEQNVGSLNLLDTFLIQHSCFSTSKLSASRNKDVDWKEFGPRINDYNSVLAKAIAGGTGHIVRGIFTLSNAYTNQVQKGGEMIQTRAVEGTNGGTITESNAATKKSNVNKSIKRVRKLSKMTEKMSKALLDGVGLATGSVMGPVMRSQAGKGFFNMVPGEVLLASLDAVNKVLDALEVAEKQTMSATSGAATRMVSNRFGESAGEATGDVLATAGHCAGTAWNIFKIRKAINPASSVSSGILKNAPRK